MNAAFEGPLPTDLRWRKVNVARHASGYDLGDNIRKRDAEVKDFEVRVVPLPGARIV